MIQKFSKTERSSFPYWFAHWCAVNMVAILLKVWKPRYLLHDILKPWHMWLCGDYSKVQAYHRAHAKHHLTYPGKKDWEMMVVDWEAGHYTKENQPLHAREEAIKQVEKHPELAEEIRKNVFPILDRLGL